MKTEIISVGTELLIGDIINSNSKFLSEKLTELGFDVLFHSTVGDRADTLRDTILYSLSKVDLIILTGGLGPTADDLTKEVVSATIGKSLILDTQILARIQKIFDDKNIPMPESNIKQALVPESSVVLDNDIGTAPGIFVEENNKIIILLPGPPKEMRYMFNKYVIPLLNNKSKYKIASKVIKTIGIGESSLEYQIKDIINKHTNVNFATYVKDGQVDIRVSTKIHGHENIKKSLDIIGAQIQDLLGDYIFSTNSDSLEMVVFNLLNNKKLKIAFAESCTGGQISSRFTKMPGISQVFDTGLITYSNDSKRDYLHVNEITLNKYGAVSQETAKEMAKGLLSEGKVDIALSVTGIAGPTGGTQYKPVGLVYISLCTTKDCFCKEYNFNGDRETIQKQASDAAFNEIRVYLENLK